MGSSAAALSHGGPSGAGPGVPALQKWRRPQVAPRDERGPIAGALGQLAHRRDPQGSGTSPEPAPFAVSLLRHERAVGRLPTSRLAVTGLTRPEAGGLRVSACLVPLVRSPLRVARRFLQFCRLAPPRPAAGMPSIAAAAAERPGAAAAAEKV